MRRGGASSHPGGTFGRSSRPPRLGGPRGQGEGPLAAERRTPGGREAADRARELIGQAPSHIDTHHWVHDHPALSWAVCELAVETGAAARTHTLRQRDEYRAKGVRTTDHFVREFQHPGHIEVADLLAVITRLEDGVTELMCHPGEPDPELLATSAYARERPIELATLTDPRVRAALERDSVALTTFAAL